MTALWVRYDRTEDRERAEKRLSKDPLDPIERTERKDPTEATESAEPMQPMERTEPLEAMDKTEFSEASDSREDVGARIAAC